MLTNEYSGVVYIVTYFNLRRASKQNSWAEEQSR